ncbi:MAG: hypothetical protein IJO80_00255 [Firmicutes bacterium]|nr:hypothetical protein [Bacillota bacterium]MBQ6841632.1 hypothetical protein [Bacillota bacterium]MBR6823927.1 hypothetical protein [Bacillota bacterium]
MPNSGHAGEKEVQLLMQALLQLETVEEVEALLTDLLTYNETQSLAQRISVAKMLDDSERYSDIIAATGASTATISRVKNCLFRGSGGYRMVLDRLKESESAAEALPEAN